MSDETPVDLEALIQLQVERAVAPCMGKWHRRSRSTFAPPSGVM